MSSPESDQPAAVKRTAAAAGLPARPPRTAKRRASKACQCCRSRKVRCNVVEHGAPCTNCRLDEVECIVTESKRKRKSWRLDNRSDLPTVSALTHGAGSKPRSNSAGSDGTVEPASISIDFDAEEHVPHNLYQTHRPDPTAKRLQKAAFPLPSAQLPLFGHDEDMMDNRPSFYPNWTLPSAPTTQLPAYIKPLPPRIGPDEKAYLERKNVLSVPKLGLRNELLRSYIEYVHPYMPILDLADFLSIVEQPDGSSGKVSLLLFHAVMFTASAFVHMDRLRLAGFETRREARKAFYLKARILYDFDYELDRVSLVQSILLLTFWYENPDDQKDTWHWMGVATSLAYSIGMHRDTSNSNMDVKRQHLWKRIWWSCIVRDRQIALGMRRPTRIHDRDYDVSMLTLDDFEIRALPDHLTCISLDCALARNTDLQIKMANMCIEQIKLCQCMAHVLAAQYSVANQHLGDKSGDEGVTRVSSVLVPRKREAESSQVRVCHDELQAWFDGLPDYARIHDSSEASKEYPYISVAKALMHMVYYTTLSALHRPEILPGQSKTATGELIDLSRSSIKTAAKEITKIAGHLKSRGLVRLLPTTGVTALLPAIVHHLVELKEATGDQAKDSFQGFCLVMHVMSKLRENYASADYSMALLEAAVRKSGIRLPSWVQADPQQQRPPHDAATRKIDNALPTDSTSVADLTTLTPPASESNDASPAYFTRGDDDVALSARLEAFLASTPPGSDDNEDVHMMRMHHGSGGGDDALDGEYDPYHRPAIAIGIGSGHDFDTEFGALVDIGPGSGFADTPAVVGGMGFDDGGEVPMQGESSGFSFEMHLDV